MYIGIWSIFERRWTAFSVKFLEESSSSNTVDGNEWFTEHMFKGTEKKCKETYSSMQKLMLLIFKQYDRGEIIKVEFQHMLSSSRGKWRIMNFLLLGHTKKSESRNE